MLLTLVAACAPVNPQGALSVTVDGVKYPSAQAAMDTQRRDSEASIAALPEEPDPILGKVRIVLPDRDRLRPFVISSNHGPALSAAALDYLINVNYMNQRQTVDALLKNRTFQSAQVVEQNDTSNPDIADADYLVFHQIYSVNGTLWAGRWQIRRTGNTATQGALFDIGTKTNSTAWYTSFIKSVREATLRLGGKTAAGAKPTGTVASAAGRTGSGLIVDTDGHIITNNHVVPSCQAIHVVGTMGDSVATVVARDTSNDLALLKVAAHSAAPASFRDSANLRAGESVVVTGFPLSGLVSSDMSITTGSLTALKGPRDDTRLLQISAQIQPGNSGGPALDNGGNVIGVVSSTLNALALAAATGGVLPQDVNFAIKTSLVQEFLATNQVHYVKAASHHEMSTPDIAEKARNFTVRVECR